MLGNIYIVLLVLVSLILFYFSKVYNPTTASNIWILLAQISGILGSVLISINFLLAIRNKLLEKMFNGIDKVYKTHDLIGNIAFVLILNHPLFLIINNLPINSSALYLIPKLSNLPYFFGILALYTLIILLVLTLFINLPYKFWKKTHELMGLVIIFGSLHGMLITSDISRFMPLRYWVIGLNILALLAYFYKRYLYYLIIPKNNYRIENIIHDKNYLILDLVSTDPNKYLEFEPGQFAFFSLSGDRRDEHPFSILEQNNQNLKVGTKIIGQFTLLLSQLNLNDRLSVIGPFGSFAKSLKKAKDIVWISGGIGITPFLSMIKSLTKDQKVTLIHSCKSDDSKIFYNMFHVNKFIHYSDKLGHLNIDLISKYINLNKDTYVFICGPNQMIDYFSKKLPLMGLRKKRIIYEDFKLK